jgi:hypothetical protein
MDIIPFDVCYLLWRTTRRYELCLHQVGYIRGMGFKENVSQSKFYFPR